MLAGRGAARGSVEHGDRLAGALPASLCPLALGQGRAAPSAGWAAPLLLPVWCLSLKWGAEAGLIRGPFVGWCVGSGCLFLLMLMDLEH